MTFSVGSITRLYKVLAFNWVFLKAAKEIGGMAFLHVFVIQTGGYDHSVFDTIVQYCELDLLLF